MRNHLLLWFALATLPCAATNLSKYQLSNPAHRLAVEFNADEARLQHPEGSVAFRLTGYGYGARLETPAPVKPTRIGDCIEYRRGEITEWYKNDAHGIEQGFTLTRRPGQPNSGEPLIIALSVEGDLRPLPAPDGDGALLGSVLRYGGLRSWDARGQTIATRLEVREREIRLVVEDREAQYPLIVDPFWTQQQKLAAPDGAANDAFGISVAVDGNTAVVGAAKSPGTAYVYVRNSPSSPWTLQQELTVPDTCVNSNNDDPFFCAVALSGDTIAIGVPRANAVYVWVRNGTTWTQQQKLTSSDGQAGDAFGSSVAVNGNTVIVGAPQKQPGSAFVPGAAYVFVRSGNLWTQQQELIAPDARSGTQFGTSIALSVDTAVISGQNEAVVYVQSGGVGPWTLQQEIGSGPGNDTTLIYVALSGDTILTGERAVSPTVGVYTRTGTTWTLQQTLSAPDEGGYSRFGFSVAVDGNTAVIGAATRPFPNSQFNQAQGAAYVFTRGGNTWTIQQELAASDGAPFDKFGFSVSISGGTVLAGAPFKNVSHVKDGAAYSFLLNSAPASLAAVSVAPSTGAGASPMFLPLYSDPNGASDLQVVYFDVGSSIFAPNSCIVVYIQAQNSLYLYNDSNSAILGPVNPQGGQGVSNSQCTLAGSGGVVRGGTNLQIPIALTFASGFQGSKNMWGLAQSYTGAQSGWNLLGSWTPFPGPALAAVSMTPTNGGGAGPLTFKATYSDPSGFNDLQVVYLDFGQTIFGANSCIVSYVQASNQLFLYNDAGTARVPGSIAEGSNTTLSNGQCTLSGIGGATIPSGFNLTVPFNLTFSPTFRGTQNVWGLAQSYSGMQSPWQSFGAWVTGLAAVSVSPNNGSGFGPQTFNATYIDPKGPTDLQVVYIDFGTTLFAPGSCIVAYVPGNSGLYLFNDASNATVAGSPIMAGSNSTLSNSQCTISGTGGTVTTSGFTLTVPFRIAFMNTFTGAKNIWGLAQSYSGAQSGWQMLGAWTP